MKRINVSFFQRKKNPYGNYSLEFIFNDVRERLKDKINAHVFSSTYYSTGFFKRLYNATEAIFKQNEVNHITGDIHYISFFLFRNKTILTILDCGFMNHASLIVRFFLKLLWLKIPSQRVKYITAISEYTKKDILTYIKCDPNKIVVIPVAIDTKYQYQPKSFNTLKPVLLQIGITPNKNIIRIIEAIKGLKVQLSVIGKISDTDKQLLKDANIDYISVFNISSEELLQKYIECDMLVFPSTFEGFGMPILEAQAVGRPVITSNVTSMPEVAGDGACIVDPFSVAEIRAGILKIISNDSYRNELIIKGLENVKRFEPNLIANMYYDLYKKIANDSNNY